MRLNLLFALMAVLIAIVLLGCPDTTPVDTMPPITLQTVLGGTFNNGAANMTVSSFRMSQYEITRAQFLSVMGTDPSGTSYSSGTSDPVQKVNWYHAIAFCNKLSLAEGLSRVYDVAGLSDDAWRNLVFTSIPITSNATWDAADADWTANGYRLPTEAEWQFAACGGTATHNYTYSGSNTIDDVAWFSSNSENKTHAVGGKTANELGFYDMSGNVWEWCWDWWGGYPGTAQTDYRGISSGTTRIFRGGSWNDDPTIPKVSTRAIGSLFQQVENFGFRVVRN